MKRRGKAHTLKPPASARPLRVLFKTTTYDGKPVRGRPATRVETAGALADAVARLRSPGRSAREAIRQVAQERGYTAEYVRQQVDWYDRHIPGIFADDWYEAARERRLEEAHAREQPSRDAAD